MGWEQIYQSRIVTPEEAIRAVQSMGVKVRSISDKTPVAHNGCRPPKKRRV